MVAKTACIAEQWQKPIGERAQSKLMRTCSIQDKHQYGLCRRLHAAVSVAVSDLSAGMTGRECIKYTAAEGADQGWACCSSWVKQLAQARRNQQLAQLVLHWNQELRGMYVWDA